jgi:hypothetical protein
LKSSVRRKFKIKLPAGVKPFLFFLAVFTVISGFLIPSGFSLYKPELMSLKVFRTFYFFNAAMVFISTTLAYMFFDPKNTDTKSRWLAGKLLGIFFIFDLLLLIENMGIDSSLVFGSYVQQYVTLFGFIFVIVFFVVYNIFLKKIVSKRIFELVKSMSSGEEL